MRLGFAKSVVLTALFCAVAGAQTYYGTIRGTVSDSSGAVAPKVEVVITNLGTNISQKFVTNDVGNYVAPNLIPGNYRVTAEMTGFKKFVADDIQLTATADRRVDVVLQLGTATDSITVQAGAQLIETEKASISDVKSREIFEHAPINTTYHSIWNLLQLAPGVNNGVYAGAGDGGNYGYETTHSIDGIPIKDGWSGWVFGPALTYLDSYREMRVDLNNANASSLTSSSVSVVSDSGTNALHGEASVHYNTVGFQARDYFAPESPSGPPTFRPNIKVGGPVYLPGVYNGKDRTFFHFTWNGVRGSQAPTVSNLVVPPDAFRTGDFSSLLPGTVLIDPTNGQPFANNQIPTSRISSVSKYLQDTFYPTANSGLTNYSAVKVWPELSNQYTVRVDQKVSDKNSLFARILYQRDASDWWDGNNPQLGTANQWREQYHEVISDTHVISPTMVNEFKFGHSSDSSEYHGANDGLAIVKAAGLQLGDLPDVKAMPNMDISGYDSLAATRPGGWTWSSWYYMEALNIVRGKHSLRLGVDISQFNGKQYPTSPAALYGTFGFDGRFSGNSYADFLLGIPATEDRSTSVSPVHEHRLIKEFYINDDYKVTPRLSLSLGLRYSLLDPGTIERNVLANFDPAANGGQGALVIPDSAQSLIDPAFPSSIPITTASSVGLSNKLLNIDHNNFAPRFGFAWRPPSTDGFVVRGGFGVYYVGMQPYISDGGGAPFEMNASYTNQLTNGVPGFAFPNPFTVSGYVAGGAGASGMNPNLRTPYSMQGNLTLEKELLGMGISGSFMTTMSRKTVFWSNLNAVHADQTSFDEKYAQIPYPYLWSAKYATNGGTHNYRAGVIKAERKFSKGLYYQAHLTYAKSVGDDFAGTEDPYNRARDRAQSGSMPRWRGVIVTQYDLPFGRGRHFGAKLPKGADYVLGGWTVNANYIWQTGMYFTPSFYGIDPSNTNNFGGRPDRIADGNLPSGERTIDHWFDTSAFVTPPANSGRFGNSGANILEGPSSNVLHFGLSKEIVLYERARLKLEGVASNLFNHPSFGIPDSEIGSPTYGQIQYTSGGARNIQLTARFAF